MKGLVFDGKGFKELKTDGENNLTAWYKAIDCDCIDIVSRKVGGKYLGIVCDDEGLLKGSPVVTAINKQNKSEVMLVGSLVFYGGVDANGDLIDITKDDVKRIKSNTVMYLDKELGVRLAVMLDY